MESDELTSRATWLMVLLATCMVELSMWSGVENRLAHFAQLAVVMAIAAGRHVARRDRASGLRRGDVATLAGLAAIPWLASAIQSALARPTEPNEVLLVHALRNLTLGLASVRGVTSCARLACVSSLFLALFSMSLDGGADMVALCLLYTVFGVWWLVGAHWDRVAGHFAASETRREVPKWALGFTLAFVTLAAGGGAALSSNDHARRVLAEWFPSSGGTSRHDPSARSGVGDGDQLVGGQEDAHAFGAVETDLFLDSDMPSLYDMFNDMYGEPVKTRTERAIPLSAPPIARDAHAMRVSNKVGRDFSTARRAAKDPPPNMAEEASPAVLQVVGPTPLLLRLQAFDAWDGRNLTAHSRPPPHPLTAERDANGQTWVRCATEPPGPMWTAPREHLIRVFALDTDHVPLPPHTTHVHIDELTRADFFVWGQDGLPCVDRDGIPPLTVLRARSRLARQSRLGQALFRVEETEVELPQADHPALRRLAQRFAGDAAPGWSRVMAVRDALRGGEYQHDRSAPPSGQASDSAIEFLTTNKRGPDYLFAVSAALLLRQLGFSTRVAGGFHVHPRGGRGRSGHTDVWPADAHFWTEVELADGEWLPVEPTPGYDDPYAPPSLGEWLGSRAESLGLWLWRARWWLTAASLACAAGWFARRPMLASCLRFVWWWATYRQADARRVVLWTVWLVELQGRLARRPRPPSMPVEWWHARPAARGDEESDLAGSFAPFAAWALYGGQRGCAADATSVRAICRAAVRAASRAPARAAATTPRTWSMT